MISVFSLRKVFSLTISPSALLCCAALPTLLSIVPHNAYGEIPIQCTSTPATTQDCTGSPSVTCYVGTAQVGFVACTVMSGIDLGCATAAEIAAASSNDKRKAEDYIERLNAAKSEIAAALVAECGEQLGQLVCVGSALPPGSHCHESAATNTGSGPGGVSCSPAAGEGEVHLSGSITCSKDCYVLTGDATPTPTLPPTPTPTNPPPA